MWDADRQDERGAARRLDDGNRYPRVVLESNATDTKSQWLLEKVLHTMLTDTIFKRVIRGRGGRGDGGGDDAGGVAVGICISGESLTVTGAVLLGPERVAQRSDRVIARHPDLSHA